MALDTEQAAKIALLRKESFEPNRMCSIVLLPIAKGFGSVVRWEPRLHKIGLAGPLEVTEENLVGCGVPLTEATKIVDQVLTTLVKLQERYPVMIPSVEDMAKRIEANIKRLEARTEKLAKD